jgi:hypothetical protein
MSEPHRRGTLPIAQSFVVCRDIIEDCRTHDFVLVAPFGSLTGAAFPAAFRMSTYAYLTNGHGSYGLTLEMRDSEDQVQWTWKSPKPIQLESPLVRHQFALYDLVLNFPEPGRYDLLLLADGTELARHVLHVHMRHPEQR